MIILVTTKKSTRIFVPLGLMFCINANNFYTKMRYANLYN